MILGVDTDVLVCWAMAGTPGHQQARRLLEVEVQQREGLLALTPQVVQEFLHVVTDSRRFENPLPMPAATRMMERLWEASEVVRVVPAPEVVPRTLELIRRLGLGRKRILDTALAVTLDCAGVNRLATFNPRDFRIFGFLELLGSPE